MLTKFSQRAPSISISAKQLDDNFTAVGPSDNQDIRQYRLIKTPDGWQIQVYPSFPEQDLGFLCFDGEPRWMLLDELVATLQDEGLSAQEINNPPSGTPGWREVERCDGKRMYVWGTEWETPA